MVDLISWIKKGQFTRGFGTILLGLALVSCTDTDGPPEDLVGTAAKGVATSGMIYATDATGTEISKEINADGFFRIDVRGMTAPFILKSVADDGSKLFSYADGTDVTVNITPLTNLALYIANGQADLSVLYNSWVSSYPSIAAVDIINAQAVVNANLSTLYTAFSLDPFTYDFIGERFIANSTGIGALLDTITVDPVAGTIVVTGVLATIIFDPVIPIVGYDIGGTSVATTGNYSLTLNIAVDGGAASGNVSLSINLPTTSLPTVGSTQLVEDMFSTFYSLIGVVTNISVVVTGDVSETIAVLTADVTPSGSTAAIYTATYTYTVIP